MACTPERSLEIGELAGGRLGAARAAGLIEHVETCSACSAELDLVADLLHVRSLPAARVVRPARKVRRWVGAVAALAAAAAVLFLFLRPGSARRARDVARLELPPVAELVLRGGEGEHDGAALETCLERLSSGDHAGADACLRALLSERRGDPLVLFYLGLASLERGDLEAALAALREVEESGTGLLAEHALWYRAQAHLARDEGGEARALLGRLIELDGDYEPNARAQLAELEALPR